MLLTDGSIMFRDQFFGVPSDLSSVNNGYQPIWKLTPDHHGSYVNGTWSELASLPGNYAPAFYASAVLPDSLVVFAGGEVNGENNFVWQGTCAIYDPVKDKWKFFDPPPFFYNLYPNIQSQHPIGDAQSVVLEDGTWMIASSITNQQALLDAKTLTWKPTGAGKFDGNDEEGWSLLPDGTVLTVDCYVNQSSPGFLNNTNSEIYDPKTGAWYNAGSTIVQLADVGNTYELGPQLLRPDGTVVAFGGTSSNAIYSIKTKTWSQTVDFPIDPQVGQLSCQDGPAALLPNGNVLTCVSSIDPGFTAPGFYYEFTKYNQFVQTAQTPNAVNICSYYAYMLVLPTGQILTTDTSTDVEIYTPNDKSYNPEWAPVIYCDEKKLKLEPGKRYKISGKRFNGMSQAVAYGDDYQAATNYPIIRITMKSSGHVFYCRTSDHSFMGVASEKTVSTHFDVPAKIPSGKGYLEVVANGIPSKPLKVKVC